MDPIFSISLLCSYFAAVFCFLMIINGDVVETHQSRTSHVHASVCLSFVTSASILRGKHKLPNRSHRYTVRHQEAHKIL